tara:strand:+ start:1265 stop:1546 length:282 start_codon:yes stop_codon:yes gene_type:complete
MIIYKLKYADKETAIADLLLKNVYVKQIIDKEEVLYFGEGIQAIVEVGTIEGVNGFHYDVMSEQDIDFGENEIIVNNPKHGFLGYNVITTLNE